MLVMVMVMHTHRGCTVMFIANHGRGNRIGNVGHRCYTCNAGHVDNDRQLVESSVESSADSLGARVALAAWYWSFPTKY